MSQMTDEDRIMAAEAFSSEKCLQEDAGVRNGDKGFKEKDHQQTKSDPDPNPTTAGTRYSVSTAPEQHMDPAPTNSLSSLNTTASIAGLSGDFMAKLGQTGTGMQQSAFPIIYDTERDQQQRTTFTGSLSHETFETNNFYNLSAGHVGKEVITSCIKEVKENCIAAIESSDTFGDIELLIKEIQSNSPLEPHTKLDFQNIFSKLESYTAEYQSSVAQIAEELQNLDETRNQWLESTYVLDGARSTGNFATLQAIILQHEEYIEQAKRDFLESLSSIRAILGL